MFTNVFVISTLDQLQFVLVFQKLINEVVALCNGYIGHLKTSNSAGIKYFSDHLKTANDYSKAIFLLIFVKVLITGKKLY